MSRVEECIMSLIQLTRLQAASHIYGISDKGRQYIDLQINYFENEWSRAIKLGKIL